MRIDIVHVYVYHVLVANHLTGAQEGQMSVSGESMCTKYWLKPIIPTFLR